MRNIVKKITLTLVLIMLFTATCFADVIGDNGKILPSVTTNIPVKHVVSGDKYSGNDTFSFVLTADNENTPMPEGQAGGSKTVTIKAGEKIDFGDITYDYPDAYYYTVTRGNDKAKRIEKDESIYRVMIAAYNDGTSDMVIWLVGNKNDELTDSGKVEEILYEDIYTAPKPPKTGDENRVKELIAVMLASAVCLGLMIKRREDIDEY